MSLVAQLWMAAAAGLQHSLVPAFVLPWAMSTISSALQNHVTILSTGLID